jgi:hypothetical protein
VKAAQVPALLARLELGDITAAAHEALLSFYEGGKLIAVSRSCETRDLFFLLPADSKAAVELLDGTNEPIYSYNDHNGVVLNGAATLDYIRFFFHFVRGQQGAFQIVEKHEDVEWCPNAPEDTKTKANTLLMPLTARGTHRSGLLRHSATVVFKNALFKTDIYVASKRIENVTLPGDDCSQDFSLGQSALHDEDLLMEDLPVNGYC